MAYIVLARKWRPLVFEDVVGQEHVTRTLMNALQAGRVAHAYIFAGPRGVGKTTTARLLAKAVNCEKQPAVNPCNNCESCRAINEGRSLDVIEIDGASNRGIDEIRNLRESIRFAPVNVRHKIYIIDEVHMLTKEAFNALLKTLEEPPEHAIFIFATTEIHKVPLTILSRCQRFDFKRIPTPVIVQQLQHIAQEEDIRVDDESLHLMARKAEGSMRDALSLLDQLTSFTDGRITANDVRQALGLIHEELYFQFTQLLQKGTDAQIIDYVRDIFRQGHDFMEFLFGLEEHFRNLLVVKTTGSARLLEVADHFREKYEQEASHFTTLDLMQYLEVLIQTESALRYSENPLLILEVTLLKLAHKPQAVQIDQLLQMFQHIGPSAISDEETKKKFEYPPVASVPSPSVKQQKPSSVAETGPEANNTELAQKIRKVTQVIQSTTVPPEPSQSSAPAESSPAVDMKAIQNRWAEFVQHVASEKMALGAFLGDGAPWRIQGNTLQIAFDPKTRFQMEQVQKNIPVLEKMFRKMFRTALKLRCCEVDFSRAGIHKHIRTPEEILKDLQEKEPVLRKIIELFDCDEMADEDDMKE